MLKALASLKGFDLHATDGSLGTVSDFLFDDSIWKVRWMVVDTGNWLPGRKVLIHPSAVISAEHEARTLNVELTKAQVEGSPAILKDRPVSQQMQNSLYGYYGWNPLWGGGMYGAGLYGAGLYGAGMYGGMAGIAAPVSAPAYFGAVAVLERERGEADHGDDRDLTTLDRGDPHLRSTVEVTGYHVHTTDGAIGHVEDFLIDNESWGVRYLVVDTSNWWFGQHVLISPQAVENVNWAERHVRLDMSKERVKSSPPWDPTEANNGEHEQRLRDHYGWPSYG